MEKKTSGAAGRCAALLLMFALSAGIAPASAQKQAPPEGKEVQAARAIEDLGARIKEFERIKAAYPQSSMLAAIDRHIFEARVGLCESVDAVDELQTPLLSQGTGFTRLDNFYYACDRVVNHRNLARFDKARVAAVIESYVAGFLKAAEDSRVTAEIPEDQKKYIATYAASIFLYEAQAHLQAGQVEKMRAALERSRKTGASLGPSFAYYSAEAYALEGRTAEAAEAYFEAAVDGYKDSETKARAFHQKAHGTMGGFDERLEAKRRELPYRAERFTAAPGWKGKAVLAELFTGSECPPCVAADLGFDGLMEAFERRYVVVLEYHLPIPGPDPLMNPATRKRQEYYGISSTPTPFFDGERRFPGGGARDRAEAKYKEYRGEVEARVYEAPAVVLQASAVRRGGAVAVDCSFDKALPGAVVNVVLVEKEAEYRGSNGLIYHKMVVRDLVALAPQGLTARVSFDLAAIESSSLRHLEAFESERAFRFREKKAAADPARLAVVLFAQDPATKKVLNAVSADVK